MSREKKYEFTHSGSTIHCVRTRPDYYDEDGNDWTDPVAWIIVIIGALAILGCLLWV